VKNLARLALFFSLSFAAILLAAAGFRFLALRLDWVRTLPQGQQTVLSSLIDAARWALSLAMYGSLLLTLSYAARKRCFFLITIICVLALSLGLSYAVLTGLDHWELVPAAANKPMPIGESGLILSNALQRNETAIVLLRGPSEPRGPRVTAIPGRPLTFQEGAATITTEVTLPPIPFGNTTPWFLRSLAIDIRLCAARMQRHFGEGLIPFLIYTGALIFFLSSLGFIQKLSAWPLANLFLGCLAFRGVLALETFFNSPEMQDVFESFLGDRLPLPLAVPLIFCGFGLLVHVYSILAYAVRKRSDYED